MNKSELKSVIGGESNSKSVFKLERITKQQLDILELIYRFRFVSTKHISRLLGTKYIQQAQQRLNTLLTKDYIGKNFSNLDRLTGKYASYYLLSGGRKTLKKYQAQLSNGLDRDLSTKVLHNIYKDKTATDRFIKHQLDLGDIYIELSRLYKDKFGFYTKSEFSKDTYEYYPQPLPDAFMLLGNEGGKNENETKEFFVEYFEDNVPFWVYRKRIKQYVTYAEEGDWESSVDTKQPKVLLICENLTLQRRTKRFLKRNIEETYIGDDLVFLLTSKDQLTKAKPDSPVWEVMTDDYEQTHEFTNL